MARAFRGGWRDQWPGGAFHARHRGHRRRDPRRAGRDLNLARGSPVLLSTANGRTEGYRTRLASLQLGDIHLQNVRAIVVPGLDGPTVLLGMSALQQLEFTQRGGTMLLRQNLK